MYCIFSRCATPRLCPDLKKMCLRIKHFYEWTTQSDYCVVMLKRYSYRLSAVNNFPVNSTLYKKYIEKLVNEYKSLKELNKDINQNDGSYLRLAELTPIINIYNQMETIQNNLISLEEINTEGDSKDKEFASLVEDERNTYMKQMETLDIKLLQLLLPSDPQDNCSDVVLEVSAGVGGQEAMLFAREMFDMYIGYISYKGWHGEIVEEGVSSIGGLRHASMLVSGEEAFKILKYEAGVHRVQRIPSTEKSGRIHTSTVTVATLPQPAEIDVELKDKDLIFETKRASGAGGQHVNTTDSAVRIIHIPTGIAVECQTDRSQIKNRNHALQRLRAKIYQQQLDEQRALIDATRNLQIKSSRRSEKIRTYNFSQDRITDHRLSGNLHNLEDFLAGGESLDRLIHELQINTDKEKFIDMISSAEL